MPRLTPLAAAALLLSAAAPALAQTNGRNVVLVEYSANGQTPGTFRQLESGRWMENGGAGGTEYTFVENNRDEWSVYLRDPQRNVTIQLDLHTKKVMYTDPSSPERREIYQIRNALDRMNGPNATRVAYTDGSGKEIGVFVNTQAGMWAERELPGRTTKYQFRETGRDEWSVYLQDDSRNVSIQLDLHTRKVMYAEGGGAKRPLYDVSHAR